ncbi:hypothetical protein SNEBB_000820 [Seison nebaliae]|nr:hypothetical protein SNEBB_000820 [Seison nebaliae]
MTKFIAKDNKVSYDSSDTEDRIRKANFPDVQWRKRTTPIASYYTDYIINDPPERLFDEESEKDEGIADENEDILPVGPCTSLTKKKFLFQAKKRSNQGYDLLQTLHDEIIGGYPFTTLPSPFNDYGPLPLLFCDYTASGKSLNVIEEWIRKNVMPYFANTHTETSFNGVQTTRFREEARDLIRKSLNAAKDDFYVIFCGSGSTAAIHKLVGILGYVLPKQIELQLHIKEQLEENNRPIVFISCSEHHSNILIWRESICDVVEIPEDLQNGCPINYRWLKNALASPTWKNRKRRYVSVTAASNITGILTDVDQISRICRKAKPPAYCFFDYASAAPYISINMINKDAIFISPHKFLGGPDTPGILVVRKSLCENKVPVVPGGGTVEFVSSEEASYIPNNLEVTEEGGTPQIIGSIRCGLVFKLKDQISPEVLMEREHLWFMKATNVWKTNPRIEIVGCTKADRISTVSFLIYFENNKYLHHDFVSALLNDVYGIQTRSGCMCAGPLSIKLLELDQLANAQEYFVTLKKLLKSYPTLKPGFCRLNFAPWLTEEEVDFIIKAVVDIANNGWKLLKFYTFPFSSVADINKSKCRKMLQNGSGCDLQGECMKYIRRLSQKDNRKSYTWSHFRQRNFIDYNTLENMDFSSKPNDTNVPNPSYRKSIIQSYHYLDCNELFEKENKKFNEEVWKNMTNGKESIQKYRDLLKRNSNSLINLKCTEQWQQAVLNMNYALLVDNFKDAWRWFATPIDVYRKLEIRNESYIKPDYNDNPINDKVEGHSLRFKYALGSQFNQVKSSKTKSRTKKISMSSNKSSNFNSIYPKTLLDSSRSIISSNRPYDLTNSFASERSVQLSPKSRKHYQTEPEYIHDPQTYFKHSSRRREPNNSYFHSIVDYDWYF